MVSQKPETPRDAQILYGKDGVTYRMTPQGTAQAIKDDQGNPISLATPKTTTKSFGGKVYYETQNPDGTVELTPAMDKTTGEQITDLKPEDKAPGGKMDPIDAAIAEYEVQIALGRDKEGNALKDEAIEPMRQKLATLKAALKQDRAAAQESQARAANAGRPNYTMKGEKIGEATTLADLDGAPQAHAGKTLREFFAYVKDNPTDEAAIAFMESLEKKAPALFAAKG
jgi:hypothetical protein